MSFHQNIIPNAPEVAAKLKLLSNPNRLKIVCQLMDGEMSVGDIEIKLGIRQPTLSREIGHLREAKIISPRRKSKVVFYSLTDPRMKLLVEAICESVMCGANENAPKESKSRPISFNARPKFTNTKPGPMSAPGEVFQNPKGDNHDL